MPGDTLALVRVRKCGFHFYPELATGQITSPVRPWYLQPQSGNGHSYPTIQPAKYSKTDVRLEWSPTYGPHLVSCQVGMVSNIWSPPCFMITITSLIIILKMTFQDTSGSFQMVGFEPGESGGLCGHTPFELVTAVKACLTSHFSLGS